MGETWAIVGSRGFDDFRLMVETLEEYMDRTGVVPDRIVSGGAMGADRLAERWAALHKRPCSIYRPEWEKYGPRAGAMRNQLIVNDADRLFAFVRGKSMTPGTGITVEMAYKKHIQVVIVYD